LIICKINQTEKQDQDDLVGDIPEILPEYQIILGSFIERRVVDANGSYWAVNDL
jgi:hypothetical protein